MQRGSERESLIVLTKAEKRDNYSFVRQVCSQELVQASVLCGQNSLEVWIQVNYELPYSSQIRPVRIEKKAKSKELYANENSFLLDSGAGSENNVTWEFQPGGPIMQSHLETSYGTGVAKVSGELKVEQPWTTAEEKSLIALRKQKKSFAEISRMLGRTELQVTCKYVEVVPIPLRASCKFFVT